MSESMSSFWRRFLLVHLPLALLGVAIAAEGVAYLLKDISLRRHDLDRIAVALEQGGLSAEVLMFGDSVTQDVLKTYRIAPPGRVANLTTNLASGAVGVMLLLKRYLEVNPPPRHLVLVASPEFLSYDPQGKTAEIYITSVFRGDDETAWLSRHMPAVLEKSWEPAVLNLEGKIGYPFLALMAPRPDGIPEGEVLPDPNMAQEDSPISRAALQSVKGRIGKELGPTPSVKLALGEICGLAREHGFEVHILRAPIPAEVLDGWRASDKLAGFENQMGSTLADSCPGVRFGNFGAKGELPTVAMREADHLRRPGWTNRYALILQEFIASLR
uniref:Uncharacterized protein n=1 Tax=uncultured marine microorganism HF4000_APKG8K5 TaxID=455555 RepID=B3TB41_9ZZZZ|nr:hypothetical protein ALOHA_HF4000APKG8K5ctg1g19 [uncultured marine microorganism HF4000_APKG8K5]